MHLKSHLKRSSQNEHYIFDSTKNRFTPNKRSMNLKCIKYDVFYHVECKWKKCLIALLKRKVGGLKKIKLLHMTFRFGFQMINQSLFRSTLVGVPGPGS